jgi:hypothetical protein
MGLIPRISVFMGMTTEMHLKTKSYWNVLSKDDRLELLQKYNFWSGFSNYQYDYIPEDLKEVISLKIDLNDEINENSTMIS